MTIKKSILAAALAALSLASMAAQAQSLPLSAGAGITNDGVSVDGTSVTGQRQMSQSKGGEATRQVNLYDLLRQAFVLPPALAEEISRRQFGTQLDWFCSWPFWKPEGQERKKWAQEQIADRPEHRAYWEQIGTMTDAERDYTCAALIYQAGVGRAVMGWPGRGFKLDETRRMFLNQATYMIRPTMVLFELAADRLSGLPPMSLEELRSRAQDALRHYASVDGMRPALVDQLNRMRAEKYGPDVRAYVMDFSGQHPAPVHYQATLNSGEVWDVQLSGQGTVVYSNGRPLLGDGYINGVQYMAAVKRGSAVEMMRGQTTTSQDTAEIRSGTGASAGTQ